MNIKNRTMKIKHSIVLKASQYEVWSQLLKPGLLDFVAYPIIKFKYLTQLPLQWQVGTYKASLHLFGLVPIGKQYIVIEFPKTENEELVLRDNGYGSTIRKWDHLVTLKKIDEETTLYIDKVEVQAGILTIFVWVFAWFFYKYRQKRWAQLVANNFRQLNAK